MDQENIPIGQWQRWIELARKYDYNCKVKAAIKAIKPRKKKRPVQVSGVPTLYDSQSDEGDNPSRDIS